MKRGQIWRGKNPLKHRKIFRKILTTNFYPRHNSPAKNSLLVLIMLWVPLQSSERGLSGTLALHWRDVGRSIQPSSFFLDPCPQCDVTLPENSAQIMLNTRPGSSQQLSVQQGGGIVGRRIPPKKIAENCRKLLKIAVKLRKIAVFGKGNCGRDLEKLQVQTESKPSRKKIFHVFRVIFTIFDQKWIFKGKIVNFKPRIVVSDPFLKLR